MSAFRYRSLRCQTIGADNSESAAQNTTLLNCGRWFLETARGRIPMKRSVSLIIFASLLSVNCAETPTTPTPQSNAPASSRVSGVALGYSKLRVGIAGHLRLEVYGAPVAVT